MSDLIGLPPSTFQRRFNNQTTKTAPYTANSWDATNFDCTSAPITQPLPSSPQSGDEVYFFNTTALGGNNLTVTGTGGPFTLVPQQGDIFWWNGSAWVAREGRKTLAMLDARYSMANPALSVTYNSDGTVASTTENGTTTTFTYNTDGTVHTETRGGVTRTFSYNADGTVSGAA